MGQGTNPVVLDGSVDISEGPRRVGGPTGRSGTGWGNLGEVHDGSGETLGGTGRVGVPLGRSRMG